MPRLVHIARNALLVPLGNDVDRAIVRLTQLTQYVEQLFNYIEEQIAKLNDTIGLMQLGSLLGSVFNVLPGIASFVGSALSIESAAMKAATGTFTKLAVEDEIELEDIIATGTATFADIESSGTSTFTDIVSTGTAKFADFETTGTATFANISAESAIFPRIVSKETAEFADISSTGTATFAKVTATGESDFGSIFANSGKIGGIDFEEGAIELEDIVSTGEATFENVTVNGTTNFTGTSTFNTLTANSASIAGIEFDEGALRRSMRCCWNSFQRQTSMRKRETTSGNRF